jgi:hypothetical protein
MFLPPVFSRARLHPRWPFLNDGMGLLDPQMIDLALHVKLSPTCESASLSVYLVRDHAEAVLLTHRRICHYREHTQARQRV